MWDYGGIYSLVDNDLMSKWKIQILFLNQARAGLQPVCTWLLKNAFVQEGNVFVCAFACM